MSRPSKSASKKATVQKPIRGAAEFLEPRQYLAGVAYGSPVNTTTGSLTIAPGGVTLADINGDGKADLLVAGTSAGSGIVGVFNSKGDGSFAVPTEIPITGTPASVGTGHFGVAAKLDVFAGTTGTPGNIFIFHDDGLGNFTSGGAIAALNDNHAMAVADFNKDGNSDVLTISSSASNNNNAAITFINSSGNAISANPFSLPFGSVSAVATGDFNGDGNPDFAIVGQLDNKIAVFLGNGDGTFKQQIAYPTGPAPTSIAVGNFRNKTINGLPELDIVTADSTGREVSFLANNGDGTFTAPVNSVVTASPTGGGPLSVSASDLNNDGIPDLISLLGAGSSEQAIALLGVGNGTFNTGATISIAGASPTAIAAGDLVGAGTPETDVVLTSSSQISSLLSVPAVPTNQLAFSQQPAALTATEALGTITVAVKDSNGIPLTSDTPNVTLAITGGGTLNGTPTVTAVGGVATFTDLSITTNGVYTLTATDGSDSPDTSTSFTVAIATTSALTPTITHSTLAAVVVSGSIVHAHVTVNVVNSAGVISSGPTTVSVYASTNGLIDGNSLLLGSITKPKLKIRSTAHTTFTISIPALSANLSGVYTLLAQVTDPSNKTTVSIPGPALTAAAPFIAFSQTPLQTTLASADISGVKTRAKIQFKVTNNGNITSKGPSQIALFTSPDGLAADGTLIRSLTRAIVLKPGASRVITLPLLTLPAVANGNYNIVARLTDPDSNTTQTSSPQYTLAAPFVSLVPSLGSIVLAHKGAASVTFTVTNQGNVAPVGPSTIAIFASSDATTTDGTQLVSHLVSLSLPTGHFRVVHVHLTAAQMAQATASGTLVIEVVDPTSQSQTLAIPA